MKTGAAVLLLGAVAVGVHAQHVAIRWVPTGGPIAGNVRQMIVQQRQLLLLGDGGWWRSPVGGQTWEPLARGPRPWVVGASDRFIYGDTIDGLIRSNDVGDTWTPCGALPVNRTIGHDVRSIAADGDRVYVSVLRIGMFHSDDRCHTWTPLWTPLRTDLSSGVVYVDERSLIVGSAEAVYVSTNAGSDWSRLDERARGHVGKTCGDVLFAGTFQGLFGSRDDGRSWTLIGLPGRRVTAVASPRCNEFFAAVQDEGRWTNTMFRSTDGGLSWTAANDGLTHHPIYRLSVGDGGAVFAIGAAAGAFQWSQDQWRQIGPQGVASNVIAAPWGDLLTATGTGLFRERPGNARWQQLLVGHDAHNSPHALSTSAYRVVVTTRGDLLAYSAGAGVLRSRDRGETWHRAGLVHFVYAFLTTSRGAVLAGTDNGIFRSNDGGDTWVERSIGLTQFRTLSLAAAADGTVYAGTSDGAVFRSSDDGDRWHPLPAVPAAGSGPVALLVTNDGSLWAARRSGLNGLARWDPVSRAWQRGSLGAQGMAAPVRALIQDSRGTMFAATEGQGMFASFDEGTTWQPENDGLLADRILSLAVDPGGSIVAATSAGVFRGTVSYPVWQGR